MAYKIITFHSRSDAFAFLNYLMSLGIAGTLVNTPREISFSCGLCIKTDADNFALKKAFANNKLMSFDKIFDVFVAV
ncbi:MAG: DUF3343 domain-containing protein, partial [Clostridia bacterium]